MYRSLKQSLVSILCPDLSHNCLGRAYLLAKILQNRFNVEIVGPLFGSGIWGPLSNDTSIKYKYIKTDRHIKSFFTIHKLASIIEGSIIYVSKPLLTSLGTGVSHKKKTGKPLILDIDDWQLGLSIDRLRNKQAPKNLLYLLSSTLFPYRPNSIINSFISERKIGYSDAITVSNSFLKTKYGGRIIYHGRDTNLFNPEKFNKKENKEKYLIDQNKKVVLFLGTPKKHKGINTLINSIESLNDDSLVLLTVGFDESVYSQKTMRAGITKLGRNFKAMPQQPFKNIPELLSIADIVAIPQQKNFATVGQTPAKIFDAMAMQKTIISTQVGDIPNILEDCAILIPPGNSKALANSIRWSINNPEKSKLLAQKARIKCVKEYSWEAMEKILVPILKKHLLTQ